MQRNNFVLDEFSRDTHRGIDRDYIRITHKKHKDFEIIIDEVYNSEEILDGIVKAYKLGLSDNKVQNTK